MNSRLMTAGNQENTNPLPERAMVCPACGYELRGAIDAKLDQCSECGTRFTVEGLRSLHRPAQENPVLRPDENRIGGHVLILLMAGAIIVIVFLLLILVK